MGDNPRLNHEFMNTVSSHLTARQMETHTMTESANKNAVMALNLLLKMRYSCLYYVQHYA